MSFSAEIEHIWMSPNELPDTLKAMFAYGACAVFADQTFTAAIPATNEQTNELADLMEIAATGEISNDDIAMKAYYVKRDELCQPQGYQVLSMVFKQEMEKLRKATMLASAARLN